MLMHTQFHGVFLRNALRQPARRAATFTGLSRRQSLGDEAGDRELSCSRQIVPKGLSKCEETVGTNEIIPQTLEPYCLILALH